MTDEPTKETPIHEQVKALNAEGGGDEQRSMTLYVEEISFEPQLERRAKQRVDVEFSNQQARELITYFQKRLALDLDGAVRISLLGRTVTG